MKWEKIVSLDNHGSGFNVQENKPHVKGDGISRPFFVAVTKHKPYNTVPTNAAPRVKRLYPLDKRTKKLSF